MTPRTSAEEMAEANVVTHEEARAILSRFNASHWNGTDRPIEGEIARYSIPARPEYDDDIRLAAYIAQNEKRDASLAARSETAAMTSFVGEVVTALGINPPPVPGEGESVHPWEGFLHARARCLRWLRDEMKEDAETTARTMSMDPVQVRMILMHVDEHPEQFATHALPPLRSPGAKGG